jgi:hypothetical protein
MVGTVRQLFRWFYKTEKWDGFRAWEECFKFKPDQLRTPTEKREARKGKPKYTTAELATLYAAATPRTRLYMLLALNCGMGAKEQATLQRADVQLTPDSGTPYIERERNKTGVLGRWTLWAETATLLQAAMMQTGYSPKGTVDAKYKAAFPAPTVKGIDDSPSRLAVADDELYGFRIPVADLAVLTMDGFPLVHRTKVNGKAGAKTSAVAAAWGRLLKAKAVKGNVANYGFYRIRGTASQFVRDIGGLESSKIFLCNSALDSSGRKSVAEKHYNERTQADFDKLAVALSELRTFLSPMFKAAVEADAAPKAKRKHKYPAQRKPRLLKVPA